MAVYLVTGRLGAGKSLVCVGKIRDAILEQRRIVTNLDLDLVALLGAGYDKHADVIRVPDKPAVRDFEAIGKGNPTMDETKNGVIVLDELAAWMNARSWGDKERQPVIDWLIHSRKKGWDVIFICQHIQQIDKQVREALVEYHVECRRLDRLKLPVISSVGQLLTLGIWSGRLPRIHLGIVRYGAQANAVIAERWVYTGTALFAAYDTRQIFTDRPDAAPWSYLPPRLLSTQRPPWYVRVLRWLKGRRSKPAKRPRVARGGRAKHPCVAPLMRFPAERRTTLYQLAQRRGLIPR